MVDQQSILGIADYEVGEFESDREGLLYDIRSVIVHLLFSTVGSMVIGLVLLGAVLVAIVLNSGPHQSRLFQILFDVPYSPAFWLSAFVLGLIVNNLRSDRLACWIWIAGAIWLVVGMYRSILTYNAPWCAAPSCPFVQQIRYSLFSLDSGKCLSGCLKKLFVTVPALSSVTYSIGAWLGFRRALG